MRNGAVINGRDDVHIDILYIFISACYNFSIVGWLPLRTPLWCTTQRNARARYRNMHNLVNPHFFEIVVFLYLALEKKITNKNNICFAPPPSQSPWLLR